MTGIILSQTLRMRAGLEPRPLLRKGVLAFAAHHWTAFVIPIHLSNSTCFFVPAAHFCARGFETLASRTRMRGGGAPRKRSGAQAPAGVP